MTTEDIEEMRRDTKNAQGFVRVPPALMLEILGLADDALRLCSSPAPVVGGVKLEEKEVEDAIAGSWYYGDVRVAETTANLNKLLASRLLRSSPAPVVGGVSELTDEAIRYEWARLHRGIEGDPDEDAFSSFEEGVGQGYALAASRLPALKPGEVVVREEEWRELRAFARISGYPEGRFSFEVPFGRDLGEWGTDIAHRMGITRDEEQAWLDSRAQATTTEKEPA